MIAWCNALYNRVEMDMQEEVRGREGVEDGGDGEVEGEGEELLGDIDGEEVGGCGRWRQIGVRQRWR